MMVQLLIFVLVILYVKTLSGHYTMPKYRRLDDPIPGKNPDFAILVRKALRWDQSHNRETLMTAGRKTGISHSTIGQMANGDPPSERIVIDFARGLGLDPNPFLKTAGYEQIPVEVDFFESIIKASPLDPHRYIKNVNIAANHENVRFAMWVFAAYIIQYRPDFMEETPSAQRWGQAIELLDTRIALGDAKAAEIDSMYSGAFYSCLRFAREALAAHTVEVIGIVDHLSIQQVESREVPKLLTDSGGVISNSLLKADDLLEEASNTLWRWYLLEVDDKLIPTRQIDRFHDTSRFDVDDKQGRYATQLKDATQYFQQKAGIEIALEDIPSTLDDSNFLATQDQTQRVVESISRWTAIQDLYLVSLNSGNRAAVELDREFGDAFRQVFDNYVARAKLNSKSRSEFLLAVEKGAEEDRKRIQIEYLRANFDLTVDFARIDQRFKELNQRMLDICKAWEPMPEQW